MESPSFSQIIYQFRATPLFQPPLKKLVIEWKLGKFDPSWVRPLRLMACRVFCLLLTARLDFSHINGYQFNFI